MKAHVRTRSAPSPTGYLHSGSVRTALYCRLFARDNDGVFLLRIEDTDRACATQSAIDVIFEGMIRLGLDSDEAAICQTRRSSHYRELAEGSAYRCYCAGEEPDVIRAAAAEKGLEPRHDGRRYDGNRVRADVALAVVVDDADMATTHVIRGDDHVNNTPRKINLLRAVRPSCKA